MSDQRPHKHTITILIDGETFEAPEKTMTANSILLLGDLSIEDNYLVEIMGNHQESFQGKGGAEIHLHERAKFISVFVGPTPVSDCEPANPNTKLIGAPFFAAQLRAEGYEVIELADSHVKLPYTVKVGKYAGLELEIGFVVPENFPMGAPSGPHINKLLHPNRGGGEHPGGGVHPSAKHSKHFSGDWQYWSRPFKQWENGPRTAVRYLGFIDTLWATQ
jgi:hypothetical protein